MLAATYIGDNKRKQRQHEGYGDVACQVCAAREDDNQSQEVHCQDEEEASEEERAEPLGLAAERAFDYAGIDEINEHLHESHALARGFESLAAIITRYGNHPNRHEQYGQDEGKDILGYGNVERLRLAVILSVEIDISVHDSVFTLSSLADFGSLGLYVRLLGSVKGEALHYLVLVVAGMGDDKIVCFAVTLL